MIKPFHKHSFFQILNGCLVGMGYFKQQDPHPTQHTTKQYILYSHHTYIFLFFSAVDNTLT